MMTVFVWPAVLCLLLKRFVAHGIGAGVMAALYFFCIWMSDPWPEEELMLIPATVFAYLAFAVFNSWDYQRRNALNKTPCGRVARHPAPTAKRS